MKTYISGNGTRTYDRTDMSRLLYQLSYAAVYLLYNNEKLSKGAGFVK